MGTCSLILRSLPAVLLSTSQTGLFGVFRRGADVSVATGEVLSGGRLRACRDHIVSRYANGRTGARTDAAATR